ncbi:glycosyltransferase 87 family protein [Streptomyces sp. NBC_00878]|uniref:glycosyltransferase 87 family protein n=1 Tax=Streptomyces sp. NBC_00878 TaxID=2975854 RepID=UPI0022582893|nr:glycosyltransferase 87 family protein [Streptomyces sp. NBC_00878]MCX4911076.1 glycosyltransferase 87 family protein [Streptomyces sp. NBC_00878]
MRPPGTDRGRLLFVLALVTAVTVFTATVPLLRDWFDLRVYHGAVDAWIHHGGSVYDYRVPGTTYGFTYPPFAAVGMLPMAVLGLHAAIAVGLLLNLTATAFVLHVLAGDRLRRYGWFGLAVTVCALALLEPVRDTFSFGQVNLVLLALVLGDAWLLSTGRARWAGVGIGLAAAIKLTPAIFIVLLLLARRPRAAATATAVAGAATALAAWVMPDASRFYWTEAVWDTTRIGRLDYVSNQSLQGVLARLAEPAEPSRAVWALAALVVFGVWVWRVRGALATGDVLGAFALTGLAACLLSPITWVHHLVWLLPSLALLVEAGLRRRRLLWIAGGLYVLLCSSVVWLWFDDASGIDGFVGSNTYVWITLGLLLGLPVGQARVNRPRRKRSTSDTAPAPSPAAPASAPAADSQPSAEPSSAVMAAGSVVGSGRDTGRGGSSDPTGSTRPAAPKPQSSSERASSYTVTPPPA